MTEVRHANAPRDTSGTRRRPSLRTVILVGLGVCIVLAAVVSLLASSHPDGLEFVAGRLGFEDAATDHHLGDSPLADYSVHAVGENGLAGGLAGLIGVLVVAALAFGLMHLLKRTPRR